MSSELKVRAQRNKTITLSEEEVDCLANKLIEIYEKKDFSSEHP
jgi:hypothetical protein